MVLNIDGHNWDPSWLDSQPQEEEPMANWEEGEQEVDKKEGDEPGDDMKETEEGTEKAEQVGKAPSEVPGEAPGVHASMQDAVAMMKHEDGFIWDQWNGRWWVGLPP